MTPPQRLTSIAKGAAAEIKVNERRAAMIILVVGVYVFFGAAFYSAIEGWYYKDALYFLMVTLFGVGYGDLFPRNGWSKLFTALYSLFGVTLVVIPLLKKMVYLLMKRKKAKEALKLSRGRDKLRGAIIGRPKDFSPATAGAIRPASGTTPQPRSLAERFPATLDVVKLISIFWCYVLFVAATVYWSEWIEPRQGFGGCVYFTIISGLTIGYGDVVPSPFGRWIAIVWVPLNVVVFSRFVYRLDTVLRRMSKEIAAARNGELSDPYDSDDDDSNVHGGSLSAGPKGMVEEFLSSNEDTSVSEVAFMKFMLLKYGITSKDVLDGLQEDFGYLKEHLGATDMAVLAKEDIRASAAESLRASTQANNKDPISEVQLSDIYDRQSTERRVTQTTSTNV